MSKQDNNTNLVVIETKVDYKLARDFKHGQLGIDEASVFVITINDESCRDNHIFLCLNTGCRRGTRMKARPLTDKETMELRNCIKE